MIVQRVKIFLIIAIIFVITQNLSYSQVIHGDLRQWHKVVIDFEGPATSETADLNPFTEYRLDVTFISPVGKMVNVPGFFTADGHAAETSAQAGNIWRVHFTPDIESKWSFQASFRTGRNIALSLEPEEGTKTVFDGASGQFNIIKSDKKSPDFRAKGILQYVDDHYLKHAGNGEYFLKGGADSPENFLAYEEFDSTYDSDAGSGSYNEVGTFIHRYKPHMKDWRYGDPVWQEGKGKTIIGALNYLASKGMNSVYFLTYNLDGGDGRDIWMWTKPDIRDRFDCSKSDQWEIVFSHMDRLGIMLHVLTQETENDHALGGGPGLNQIRKLYYRELIARFSHHLAVVWNLGEENNTPDSDRKEIARYIRALDPYDHPITVHTHAGQALAFYNGILGDPFFETTSIQGSMENYNHEAAVLRQRSTEAGRKWVIFGDEQNPAERGVLPDESDPNHDLPRKQALWGNLMGGGSGVEWYFGYKFPHMDINCEDWRSRDRMWDQTRHALEFFRKYLSFVEMGPANTLTANPNDYCFAKQGDVYAIYLPDGGTTELKVENGTYSIYWYNPRDGGDLQYGSIKQITGPGNLSIGYGPKNRDKDWAILVQRESLKP